MTIRRRVRPRAPRSPVPAGPNYEQQVQELLSQYKALEDEMEPILIAMAALKTSMAELMEEGELEEVLFGMYQAKYAAPPTRATTTIDPQKFSDEVSPEEFWDCVSISVTKAREVMSERALQKVSTTTNPEPKPPVLTVTKKKAK